LSQNAKLGDVPSGKQVENLPEIAHDYGYPPQDAQPWILPDTAVEALPSPAGAPGGVHETGQPNNPAQDKGATRLGRHESNSGNGVAMPRGLQGPAERPNEQQTQWNEQNNQ
jgi:hypothetical protein